MFIHFQCLYNEWHVSLNIYKKSNRSLNLIKWPLKQINLIFWVFYALFWSLVQVRKNFSFFILNYIFYIQLLTPIENYYWKLYCVHSLHIPKEKIDSLNPFDSITLLWSCIYFLGNFFNQDTKINKNSFMRNILGCLVNAFVQILDWNIFLKGKKYHIHNIFNFGLIQDSLQVQLILHLEKIVQFLALQLAIRIVVPKDFRKVDNV